MVAPVFEIDPVVSSPTFYSENAGVLLERTQNDIDRGAGEQKRRPGDVDADLAFAKRLMCIIYRDHCDDNGEET